MRTRPDELPPASTVASHTPTLTAISVSDVVCGLAERRPPYGVRPCLVCLRPCARHSGHWNPTAASFMQSGQIGRLHRWQRMWLSRSVCR